jgi:hypothetical protein
MPGARAPGTEGLHAPPVAASSLTIRLVGTAGVVVLLIRSLRTDSDAIPFGVATQEQQLTNTSSEENV